jgi:hypothetical protein
MVLWRRLLYDLYILLSVSIPNCRILVAFSLPKPTSAIIVLSQLDTRYFKEIAGVSSWTLEFALVKRGEEDPLAEAIPMLLYSRSVNLEINLEAGEYVVYVSTPIKPSACVLMFVRSVGPIRSYKLQGSGKTHTSADIA